MNKDTWKETKRTGKKGNYWLVKRKRFSKRKPKIMNGTIKAKQYAIKTSKNSYRLIMKGTKYKKKRKRRWHK